METTRLEEAINEYIRSDGSNNFILTDWVLVTASTGWDEDGEGLTEMGVIIPDRSIPHYKIIGLLEYAKSTKVREVSE